jgi:hypothetical protein
MRLQPVPHIRKLPALTFRLRSSRFLPDNTGPHLRRISPRWRAAHIHSPDKIHRHETRSDIGKRRHGPHILYEEPNDQ